MQQQGWGDAAVQQKCGEARGSGRYRSGGVRLPPWLRPPSTAVNVSRSAAQGVQAATVAASLRSWRVTDRIVTNSSAAAGRVWG